LGLFVMALDFTLGDAKRKGKVERPFRDLKESFLQELVVTGVPAPPRLADPSNTRQPTPNAGQPPG